MSDPVDDGVARARTELAAARLLADNGFGAQAVSRAYYAAFYVSEAALSHLGETRGQAPRCRVGHRASARPRPWRRRASRPSASVTLRAPHQVEYRLADVSDEEARRAVSDAETVVDIITAWLVEQ